MKRELTLKQGKYWAKKIRGKVHYFGTDYDDAILEYLRQKPYLESGVAPPLDQCTVATLLNSFLSHRKEKLDAGNLSQRTYDDYLEVCKLIAGSISKHNAISILSVEHFEAIRQGLMRAKNKKSVSPKRFDIRLGYARTIFRFASIDNRFIDRQLPFQSALASVPDSELRKHRQASPKRSLTAGEITQVLEIADTKFKAIILLAINGALNNSDIKTLKTTNAQIAISTGKLEYPREKTHFMRVTPLWPETIEALKIAIDERYPAAGPELFLTASGKPYCSWGRHDLISKMFYRYLNRLGLYSPGKNFGALRTTFSNIGKEVGDDLALKALMGHSDGSTLYENYADGVYVPRLKKITDHVRKWLFN